MTREVVAAPAPWIDFRANALARVAGGRPKCLARQTHPPPMTQAGDPRTEIYQLALHAAPSGIMVVGERGDIRFANQTLADMFGHRLEELLGKPVEILLPEQYFAAHRRHVENYARRPEPRPMGAGRDLEGVSKDGRRFPVEIGLRPAQTDSGWVVVATVIDISRRKAIEERLRKHEEQLEELVAERTRELREAQREKERVLEHLIQAEKMTAVGTLISGIGHEINNPLYVVLAAAEALADEEDLARCRAHGQEILKQARNIAETVKNLSRYVQPAARHDLQRVDVNASIAGAVHMARRALRHDRIEIKTATSPVPDILARPEEIQQVVFNVVRNAIQAVADRGLVEIRTAQEGDWVTVLIQDTGTGIPNEHLKRVFDPFFTTKGPDEGEGLGLYIVRQIVTRYRGTIDVENAAAGGARFSIRFPIAQQKNAEGRHP
jgi:PAS domain S-box-containing protein